jgi:hypothetical protein
MERKYRANGKPTPRARMSAPRASWRKLVLKYFVDFMDGV